MLEGSCLCGKIRYALRGAPMAMYYCHCVTCRKASGSSFATNILARAEDLEILTGKDLVKAFESSPAKHRHFCSACGSPLYSQAEATKHVISIRCGTLDGDPGIKPSVHAYVASKAPWLAICDDVAQLPAGIGG